MIADQSCDCNSGWKGDGCEIPDCPGNPDCSGLGRSYSTDMDSTTFVVPLD